MRTAFPCEVTCEGEAVSANWSINPTSSTSSCNSPGSSVQCQTDSNATISVTNASYCGDASAAITLSYYDLALTCSPTTINSGGNDFVGESFSCHASGGDENYTWFLPSIVVEDSASTASAKNLRVEIGSANDYPESEQVIIKVQDGLNNMAETTINLLPPGVVIEDIYMIGNSGITIGSTEDVYVQLNAYGKLNDIETVQARLIKGVCTSTETCANNQIFNVMTQIPVLQNSSFSETGSVATHNLLYKVPIFTPDYEELTDGVYSYEIAVYDQYNQKGVAYLQTFVGILMDGDINGDQSVDIIDIVKTVMYYLNPSEQPKDYELNAVDFNNNQQIDLADVVKVIQEGMRE